MIETRRELLDLFQARTGTVGDASARNEAELRLNLALDRVWRRMAWSQFLSPTPYQFTTVAGTRAYVLPAYFGRVASVGGRIRNLSRPSWLLPISNDELTEQYPEAGTAFEVAGCPQRYVLAGTCGVHTQPSSAGEACEAVSSSAADIVVRVVVEGLNAAGIETRTETILTGETAVDVGTWSKIIAFAKAYPDGTTPTSEHTSSQGTVTLRTTSGLTELQALLPDESARELQTIVLQPTPNAADTIAVPFLRRPRPLRYDADTVPQDWDDALLEAMLIDWRVDDGDVTLDAGIVTPRLDELVVLENSKMAQSRRERMPFGGYRR